MPNRNVTPSFTLENFRVEFNELSDDVGNFNSGITNSIPSGAGSSTTVETAVKQTILDIEKIIDGTYSFTGNTISFNNDVNVGGDLDVVGNITLGGNITTGDSQPADTVTVVARFDSNLIPKTDSTYDLGSSSLAWNDAFIDDIKVLGGTSSTNTTTGSLVVTGGTGISENLNVGGNLNVEGNSTIGSASTDTITVTAEISSNAIPSVDSSYDLGSNLKAWQTAYIDSINVLGGTNSTSTSTGDLIISGGAGISQDLHVGGDVFTTEGVLATSNFSISVAIALS